MSRYAASVQTDVRAIEALGGALAGSGRPLVVTSGVRRAAPGEVSTEDLAFDPGFPRRSEPAAWSFIGKGVRVVLVRLPPTVHGAGDRDFVPELIRLAKEKGVSGFVGDGANRWPSVHRLDAARAPPGHTRARDGRAGRRGQGHRGRHRRRSSTSAGSATSGRSTRRARARRRARCCRGRRVKRACSKTSARPPISARRRPHSCDSSRREGHSHSPLRRS